MDASAVSNLFASLDRELWLVTTQAGSRRGGLIATFVCQASIVPELPRILVGLAHQHYTWELVEKSNAFALHLLSEEQLNWVWRFALGSGRGQDKLDGLRVRRGISGSPILEDAVGWLDCRIEGRLESGDRTIYLAEVLNGGAALSTAPLTSKRLLQLTSPTQRTELKQQFLRDSAIDAEAIRNWRAARSAGPQE